VVYRILFTAGPLTFTANKGPFTDIPLSDDSTIQATGNNNLVGCYNYEIHARFYDKVHDEGIEVVVETAHDPQIDNLPPIPPPPPEPPPTEDDEALV
jgi:hypothetical protein